MILSSVTRTIVVTATKMKMTISLVAQIIAVVVPKNAHAIVTTVVALKATISMTAVMGIVVVIVIVVVVVTVMVTVMKIIIVRAIRTAIVQTAEVVQILV